MKIVRYFHNKMNHRAVLHHGQVLSLQTDLSVLGVLNLPRAERDYLEGQSGKYLKAPMGLYPLATPLDGEDLKSLVLGEAKLNPENIFGSGAVVALPTPGTVRAEAAVVGVSSESKEVLGHCLLVSLYRSGSVEPFASVLGPYITTVDELKEDSALELKVSVEGSGTGLDQLAPGDKVLVSTPALGQLELSLQS